jgi:predicted ATPase
VITLIEALNFRCLRYVRQSLKPFLVLVGPNASGKTTFLDVVAFLGRLVSDGVEAAVTERTQNFQDFVWGRADTLFELAIEAKIPDDRRSLMARAEFDTIRYEVRVGLDEETGELSILGEKALLKVSSRPDDKPRGLFPESVQLPKTILAKKRTPGARTVVNKVPGGNDNFYSEASRESGKGWFPSIRLGPRKSALGNLPEDDTTFPVSTWLRRFLAEGVQRFILNSQTIRKASPPGRGRGFRADGSNLPWVLAEVEEKNPDRLREWVAHLQTALPDLKGIRTIERKDDKHRYIMLRYGGGLEIPSWMASDGTLRLLALTLPAYLPDFSGVYLIEEPENGVHPKAVETMYQSLSSVYGAQILLATHSPVILSVVDKDDVLCFARRPDGSTDIVLGSQHPALAQWRGETNLGMLFAAGVLG